MYWTTIANVYLFKKKGQNSFRVYDMHSFLAKKFSSKKVYFIWQITVYLQQCFYM